VLVGIKACMDAREPVNEEKFEVRVDVNGIKDGPKLGRLRASKKVNIESKSNFLFARLKKIITLFFVLQVKEQIKRVLNPLF
jgi:hypothetical protein